jgi:L-lactate dehydrogenase complex protein LldG
MKQAKNEILAKLKCLPEVRIRPRPFLPPLPALFLDRDELVNLFSENLASQTGVVYRVKDAACVRARLADIAREENLKAVMASTDSVISPLNLVGWGKEAGVDVLSAKDFAGREAFTEAVFNKVQAGITGVDFALAESGTICLIHDQNQPRLISIAPILHIAVLPLERLYPVYEQVTDRVFADKNKLPGHFTFTTGPSMTADIQGGQFKGMHGPGKVTVIVIG